MDRLRTERHPRVWHISGEWKVTALEAEIWVDTVTEGERQVHGRVEEIKGRRD